MSLTMNDLNVPGFHRVIHVLDPSVSLEAIIALHDTRLGPALGGIRIHPYASFQEGLFDVCRLAEGMTYKAAISMSGTGGGKSVIFADPEKHKTPALLRSFARAIEMLKGIYIGAEDVGCDTHDVEIMSEETQYLTGLVHEKSSGDPSPFTAWGVVRGMQAGLKFLEGSDSFFGKTVAIQGLGKVGTQLIEKLFWLGADLVITDRDLDKAHKFAQKYGARVVAPEEIHSVECDIFAPCALGGVINETTIPKLSCKMVAGAANNQLLNSSDADLLKARGILYVPDYIINSGGLINVSIEIEKDGYNVDSSRKKVHRIYDQLLSIFQIAKQNSLSTLSAAQSLADYRLRYGIGARQAETHFHHAMI